MEKDLFNYLFNNDNLNLQRRYNERANNLANAYYDKEAQYASNLFNRNYYRDYLQTPMAQNMLKQVRNQLGNQLQTMRNTSNVMGLTGESMAAMQKNNNQMLDSVAGKLAEMDVMQKDRALNSYENVRNRLGNFVFNLEMDKLNRERALEEQKYKNIYNLFSPLQSMAQSYVETNKKMNSLFR